MDARGQQLSIVDSHCHATPVWYADLDALVFEQDRNHVEHAVLVQIGNFFDNTYQFDALRRFQERVRAIDAGVVDEHVELDFLRQSGDGGQVGHVERVRDAAGALGQAGQCLGTACERMDPKPFAAQPFDDRSADAGRCTGDESGLVVGEEHGVPRKR